MRLKIAAPADLPAVAALMNRAYRGPAVADWKTEARYIGGQRTSEAMLGEDLAANSKARLLLAKWDGVLQGCVWLEPAGRGAWELGSLTVASDLQNAGFGGRLLEAAEAWAARQGAAVIRMKVVHVREELIAWYGRRGYALTGETTPFPYGDHRFGEPLRDDLTFVVLQKTF